MSDLYKYFQKIVPFCNDHTGLKLTSYDVQQQVFMCSQCSKDLKQAKQSISCQQYRSKPKQQEVVFTLKQIVQIPILLMLKKSSFLSTLNAQKLPQYHSRQFLNILTDMDGIIKTKKQSHNVLVQFLGSLKQQISQKIQKIIEVSQNSLLSLTQIQQQTKYLKNISKQYSNQFLQSLQDNFTNGLFQELQTLFKKYSIENQNPFRIISQKVQKITRQSLKLNELNWQHLLKLSSKILDPYIWKVDEIFKVQTSKEVQKTQQKSIILPSSEPFALKYTKTQNKEIQQSQMSDSRQVNSNQILYLRFTQTQIQLLYKQNQQFVQISKFQNLNNSKWDMIYQLPRKMFMAIQYQGIQFYSYDFNRISLIDSIKTVKGSNQVLIFQDFCLVLAIGKLYKIYYNQLGGAQQLYIQKKGLLGADQILVSMEYLFRNNRKISNQLILNITNKYSQETKSVVLSLY